MINKKEIKNNRNKRMGISLIVLVITIIVIIILASAVILSLNQSGIINKANEAKFKSDVDTFKTDLSLYKANKILENTGKYDSKLLNATVGEITYDGIKEEGTIVDVIQSMEGTIYEEEGKFQVIEGELVYIGENEQEIKWSTELGIASQNAKLKIAGLLSSSTTDSIKIEVKLESKMTSKVTYKYTVLKGEEIVEEKTDEKEIYEKKDLKKKQNM